MSYKNLSPGEVKSELDKLECSPSAHQAGKPLYKKSKSRKGKGKK